MKLRFGFRDHFQRKHSLRWHMSLLLLVSGSVGLLGSRLLLQQGWENVIGRYPLAVLMGYLAFILSFWLWLIWVRWQYSDRELEQFDVEPGGIDRTQKIGDHSNVLDWFDIPDAEGIGCLIIAVLVFLAALFFGGWLLISDAAIVMTDVAVQFLFAGLLTRRLKYVSNAHWLGSILAVTFWPMLWTLVAAIVLGFAISVVCPQAHSLRDAFATSCRRL
ncbi:hypothetical protein HPT27_03835 [Permianibacter sp. IMCC34836]|uniref:hypothetical protein n=1 Tax=Permianibacter fluminis TaxID=2738515 RepID=UPI0015547A30|nr:hypothetical protein [Permianibacter fluminis]NQD36142.1 hypothetical protein [Permianibacter fluminis]